MPLRIQCVCVDTADPARLASFWQSALGWRRTFEQDGQVVLEPPEDSADDARSGLAVLAGPRGEGGQEPPASRPPAQDQAAEVARLEGLGASRADVGQGQTSAGS